jgi:hypothetical protein
MIQNKYNIPYNYITFQRKYNIMTSRKYNMKQFFFQCYCIRIFIFNSWSRKTVERQRINNNHFGQLGYQDFTYHKTKKEVEGI